MRKGTLLIQGGVVGNRVIKTSQVGCTDAILLLFVTVWLLVQISRNSAFLAAAAYRRKLSCQSCKPIWFGPDPSEPKVGKAATVYAIRGLLANNCNRMGKSVGIRSTYSPQYHTETSSGRRRKWSIMELRGCPRLLDVHAKRCV